MLLEYLRLQGFAFRSQSEERQLQELLRSNPAVRDKLTRQVQEVEGSPVDTAIFQKRLEVAAKLQQNNDQLKCTKGSQRVHEARKSSLLKGGGLSRSELIGGF
jgi:hypothetical protein